VRSGQGLCDIFFEILSLVFFERVAQLTTKYCYNGWVVQKRKKDSGGNELKLKAFYFVPVSPLTDGVPTPNRGHRSDNERVRYQITSGFIITWIGILVLQGAHFGSEKRTSRKMWQKGPYGLSIPYVWNSMSRDAHEFLRCNIHLADNSLQQPEGSEGYDSLFKVRYPLDVIGKGLQKIWTTGQHITIDESMIKYCGRAVAFIQYMPAKPIKHGIKVFCVCCAISGIMLACEVYCGNKDKKTDGTVVNVCDRLVKEAELMGPHGCSLYTDNYYMSMKLAKHLFEKYRWTMVGKIVPTDKKTREDHDIPFLKLSNGARNGLERGWFCEACLKLHAGQTQYYVQCTTWKDKKQVSFLSTNKVRWSEGMSVQRRVQGKRTRDTISAP
jgi:hypothetical protein